MTRQVHGPRWNTWAETELWAKTELWAEMELAGPDHVWSLKICRHSVQPQAIHPTTHPPPCNSTDPTYHNNMKYLESCNLKALIKQAITNLERKIIEGSITAASRKRRIAAHVSHPFNNLE